MKKIVVVEKNGVCVPLEITPIFRKVFTKDRLPNIKDGELIDTSLGDIQFFSNHIRGGIWKYNIHTIEWWLEEVKLPSDEVIDKEFSWAKGFSHEYQEKMLMGRKGAKWMKDFVLAVTPLNSKTNDH